MASKRFLRLDIFLPQVNNNGNNTLEPIPKQEVVIEALPLPEPQQKPRPVSSVVLDVGNNLLTTDPVSRISTAGRYNSANNIRSEQMLHSGRSSRGRLAEDYKSLMFKHTDLEQVFNNFYIFFYLKIFIC